MKKIIITLLILIMLLPTNWTSVSAGAKSSTSKNTTYEIYYKILEQRHWQDNVYSPKGKQGELIEVYDDQDTFYQNSQAGVAYAKLIDFDGDGTEELYLHYITNESGNVYAIAEVWTVNKNKAKLAFKEKIQSNGSHISDGEPIIFCKVKGKTYFISQSSFTTGAGYFDYQSESIFMVSELRNGKVSEKYTITETWTDLNKSSNQYKKYGDTILYEWNISQNGKTTKLGKKAKVDEQYHAKDITKVTSIYKNTERIIGAGSFEVLNCQINNISSCLNNIRKKITDTKLKNTLAQKVKSSQPCDIVKMSGTSITIRGIDNFYSDGADEEKMMPSKNKKTYTIDKYTKFSLLNDYLKSQTVSKSKFMKNYDRGHFIINYKGKRVISISEIYHP